MKRYCSFILCLLCLALVLCIPVSAATPECTISEDFETLYFKGETYTRINSRVFNSTDTYYDTEVSLSPSQAKHLHSVDAVYNDDTSIVDVTLVTAEGTQIYMSYLRSSLLSEYRQALSDQTAPLTLEFYIDNITASQKALKGKPTTLNYADIYYNEIFSVLLPLEGCSLQVLRGMLLVDGIDYYYIDYGENNVVDRVAYDCFEKYDVIYAYEITDPSLCDAITKAYTSEYSLGMGLDEGGAVLTGVLMSLIFAVLPFIILILALIFSFCSKQRFYRNAWRITAGLTAAELTVFIIVAVRLLMGS